MGKHRKHQKTPAFGGQPIAGKTPRFEVDPDEARAGVPAWRVRGLDLGGPFGWHDAGATDLRAVADKLGHFETMRWADIESAGSHAVEVGRLCAAAQKRLRELRQDDVDELFSLRLAGRARVWGFREGRLLRILWWDPEHAVCPAEKKHT